MAVRDPDFWIGIVAWTTVLFSCAQILLFAFGRDQGIYAVVGDGLLHGKMPYRDLWDFKPPGIYFIYALAQALFGKSMVSPRWLEVFGLILTVVGFRRLGEVFFGSRAVGLLGGAMAALTHAELEFWHTGQPEAFAGFLTVGALVLLVAEVERKRRPLIWIGVGVCFGICFLLKPHLGGGALVCAAHLARTEFAERGSVKRAATSVCVLGAATLLPVVLCIGWFAIRGAFGDLRWTLFDFAPGYTMISWHGHTAPEMFYMAIEEGLFRFSALAAVGVIAALILTPMHGREREALFLVFGVMSVHFAGIAMQAKFFQYHFSATLPLVCFIGGLGIYKLWRRFLVGGTLGVTVFGAFVIIAVLARCAVNDVPKGFWARCGARIEYLFSMASTSRDQLDRDLYYVSDYNLDADRRVAFELAQRTRPDAKVFVWGFEPAIYWLSDRAPASRFIYDVPQRTSWESERPRRTLIAELEAKQPAFIVVQRNDVFNFVTGNNMDSRAALDDFPRLNALVDSNYALVDTIEDFQLFQRRSAE